MQVQQQPLGLNFSLSEQRLLRLWVLGFVLSKFCRHSLARLAGWQHSHMPAPVLPTFAHMCGEWEWEGVGWAPLASCGWPWNTIFELMHKVQVSSAHT